MTDHKIVNMTLYGEEEEMSKPKEEFNEEEKREEEEWDEAERDDSFQLLEDRDREN